MFELRVRFRGWVCIFPNPDPNPNLNPTCCRVCSMADAPWCVKVNANLHASRDRGRGTVRSRGGSKVRVGGRVRVGLG